MPLLPIHMIQLLQQGIVDRDHALNSARTCEFPVSTVHTCKPAESQNWQRQRAHLMEAMSNFSIDYILNHAGEKYVGSNASVRIMQRFKFNAQHFHPYARQESELLHLLPQQPPQQLAQSFEEQAPMYDWLQYTRYHPPKLPRSFARAPAKRTPGRLPRIPFSPAQLQALECAYKDSNYLSAEDANRLAASLELTNTRVKIWFQNRRARERREKREREESYDSTFSSNASSPEPESDMIVIV